MVYQVTQHDFSLGDGNKFVLISNSLQVSKSVFALVLTAENLCNISGIHKHY